jgi:hypothetical protein
VIGNYFKDLRDALFVYNGQVNPEPRGYAAANNALIASNAFENCLNNLILGVGDRGRTLSPRNLRIEHNLIHAKSGRIIQQPTLVPGAAYKGNVMFGADLGIPPQPGIELRKPTLPKPVHLTVKDVGPSWMK